MNKSYLKFASLLLGTFFLSAIFAAPNLATPLIPQPPNVKAKGFILLDANSGYVIAQANSTTRMAPASLTKIMSLYLIADNLEAQRIHLTDNVRVSENAWRKGGSRMFINVGSSVPLATLINGIAVASGNDATVAVAEFIAGSEDSFANLMNMTASRLGMKDSNFVDSNGLPAPNHYTTPADLGTLARAFIRNHFEYYPWFSQKWFVFNNIKQPNRNRLLWQDPSVDGFKTGHTDDAGYCLISSANRNGMRLISVIMGEPSDKVRTVDSEALLNYGFRFYESHKIIDHSQPIANLRTWFGSKRETPVGIDHDVYVTTPIGQYKNIKVEITKNKDLTAPIKAGQECGVITATLNNQQVLSQPIIAMTDNPKAGFFARLWDHLVLFI